MKQMWKKGISILMAVVLIISGMTCSPFIEQKAIAAVTESAVPEGYTPIRTVDELYAIRNNLNGKFILMNDIDLSEVTAEGGELDTGHGWTPIQNFAGTFDGGGYRIKGMQIRGKVPSNYVGLFGRLDRGSVIKNVGLVDVDININSENFRDTICCGSLVGNVSRYGKIEKCFVNGQISIKSENNEVIVGGIASFANIIADCYNGTDIMVENDKNNKVCAGGIIGEYDYNEITNCYNRGTINNGQSGAIVGRGYNNISESSHCYYLQGTGTDLKGGTPLTDSQMKKSNYFTGYDFKDIWEVDPDSLYTYPQLKSCMQIRIKDLVLEEEPVKKEYNQGDKLDISGGKLKITYEDDRESTAPVTDLMVEAHDMMQIGEQEIHIRKGNMTVPYTITVNAISVTKVTLDQGSLFMERGDTATLTAKILPTNATVQDIEWSSDNDDVVTVDQKGKVRAISIGKANVTAAATNGVKAVCSVTVAVTLPGI